jgi:hypothetical protein
VESRTGVTEALLTSAESSEVGGGLGDDVVEELEGDSASGLVWRKSQNPNDLTWLDQTHC